VAVDDGGVVAGKRWAGKRRRQGCGHGQGGGDRYLRAIGVVWMRSACGSDRVADGGH
jgi:hypothetical protein